MFRMRQAIGAAAILAIVATGCTSGSIFGPVERVVTGTVSYVDGTAAAGATVTSDTGARTVADGAGRFSLRAPRGADVLIRATERLDPGKAYAVTRSGSVLVKSYDAPSGHTIALDQVMPI